MESAQKRSVGMSDWSAWVGRRTDAAIVLDPAQANRMAVTLDREPSFGLGDLLPPAWHWLYVQDFVRASSLGRDGHPALGEILPPVGLPRRMWAGGSIDFLAPIPLGSEAKHSTTIRSITPKSGRSGELVFLTLDHELDIEGTPALRESQTIVFRHLASPHTAAPVGGDPAPTVAQYTDDWTLDSTHLFRYSALTFNAHRIHYDADYCRSVEGYPNPVIHGPLLATLMLDSVVRRGDRPSRFEYRARSPLFLPESFTVNGSRSAGGTDLWVAAVGGRLAMDGRVALASEGGR
jgi:3-methylfumaryl-CoA hydratase